MPVHVLDCIRRPASGAVSVRIVLEVGLEDWFQHDLGGSLNHPITDGWNSERTLASTIRFRDITRRTGSGRYVFCRRL
jgi:hypothetical protein